MSETSGALQYLKEAGKILDYGVSNFDTDDLEEALSLPGGEAIATNQVLYNLMNRGIEWDLLPWRKERNIPIMAYSSVESRNKSFCQPSSVNSDRFRTSGDSNSNRSCFESGFLGDQERISQGC